MLGGNYRDTQRQFMTAPKSRINFGNPNPSDKTSPAELLLTGHTIVWPTLNRYLLETDDILRNKHFVEEKVYQLQPGFVYVLWLTDEFEIFMTPKLIDTRGESGPSTHHEKFQLTFPDPNEKTHFPVLVRVPVDLVI